MGWEESSLTLFPATPAVQVSPETFQGFFRRAPGRKQQNRTTGVPPPQDSELEPGGKSSLHPGIDSGKMSQPQREGLDSQTKSPKLAPGLTPTPTTPFRARGTTDLTRSPSRLMAPRPHPLLPGRTDFWWVFQTCRSCSVLRTASGGTRRSSGARAVRDERAQQGQEPRGFSKGLGLPPCCCQPSK